MNLQKIYYFIKIVETLSLKKAADALFVSRQALSKQMQQLEEELGVCLLERTTNRIVVTEAGKKLYELYKPVVQDVEHARAEMERFLQYKNNFLKIAYFSPLSYEELIAPMVERWHKRYPDSHVDLIAAEAGTDRELIVNDSVDLLVTTIFHSEEWDSVEVIPLCTKKMVIIVSDKHKWYDKETVTIEDLAEENMLIYGNRPNATERSFLPDIRVRERVAVYNSTSYMANLRLGDAFGIVSDLQIPWEGNYRLIDLPAELACDGHIAMVLKPLHPLAERIRELAGEMRDYLQTE